MGIVANPEASNPLDTPFQDPLWDKSREDLPFQVSKRHVVTEVLQFFPGRHQYLRTGYSWMSNVSPGFNLVDLMANGALTQE